MAKKVKIECTVPQARMINDALALFEAEDHGPGSAWEDYSPPVMDRTRRVVWDALAAVGVEP